MYENDEHLNEKVDKETRSRPLDVRENNEDLDEGFKEIHRRVLDSVRPDVDEQISARANEALAAIAHEKLLLSVAARIFPGVATAWSGAPEMVARHTVEVAQMLIDECRAKFKAKLKHEPEPEDAGTE